MDLITIKPKMLEASIDFNLIENYTDRDILLSLFLVAGAIGNDISCNIDALGKLSKKTVEIIKEIGGHIEEEKKYIKVRRSASMKGIDIDLNGCEEILPFIALLCAFSKGKSRISGIKDTRYVSLIKSIASEFSHLGITVEQTSYGLIIHGGQTFNGDGAYVWNSSLLAMTLITGASRSEGELRIFGLEGIEDDLFKKFLKITKV